MRHVGGTGFVALALVALGDRAAVQDRVRKAALLFAVVALVPACGSSGGPASSNDATDGGGVTADAGDPSPGNPSGCPSAAPADGAACSLANGLSCTYGKCGVVTTAACGGGHWSLSRAGVMCASDAGSGASCSDQIACADSSQVCCGYCGSQSCAGTCGAPCTGSACNNGCATGQRLGR